MFHVKPSTPRRKHPDPAWLLLASTAWTVRALGRALAWLPRCARIASHVRQPPLARWQGVALGLLGELAGTDVPRGTRRGP